MSLEERQEFENILMGWWNTLYAFENPEITNFNPQGHVDPIPSLSLYDIDYII